jgi:predicted enzyme related to lactoylglutathione lyase
MPHQIVSALAVTALLALPAAPGARPDGAAGATLADLAFMSGAWRGEFQGSVLEEHFSEPADGTILGMFRWGQGGATRLTEHIVIEQDGEGITMRLRHFNPGLVPWAQEADGPLAFRLASVGERRAVFEDPQRSFPARIVYDRTQPNTLVARLEGRGEQGEDRSMEFVYRSLNMTTSTVASDALTKAGQALGYNGGLTIELPVADLDKAIDFYQNVVGFKLVYKLDDMGWCELSTSVPRVYVGLSQVEHPKPGGQTPVFGVKDVDAARKTLETRGARFDGDTVEIPGMVKLATFYDLDGNPMKLFQSLSDQMP